MIPKITVASAVFVLPIAARAGEMPLIADAALFRVGLTPYWTARLPLSAGDSVKDAFLVDEALYVSTDEGILFALTADVGLIRWGEKLTERDYTIQAPSHVLTADAAGPLVVATTSRFYVMERFSGDTIAAFRTEFPPGSAAVGVDNIVYLGSADGKFYSLIWSPMDGGKSRKRWEVIAGSPVTAKPILHDQGKLLFATQKGVVVSCFAADKAYDWSFESGDSVLGDPFVDESGVYVSSLSRSLYKLDSQNGVPIWRFRAPVPLRDGPMVIAHTVYQYCQDHGLVAIDSSTGEERWRRPTGLALATHSRRGDYVFTIDRQLELVDHETGKVFSSVPTSAHYTITNVRNDSVYLLAKDGGILCARPTGGSYLRAPEVDAVRDRLRLAPPADTALDRKAHAPAEKTPVDRDDDPLRSRKDRRP